MTRDFLSLLVCVLVMSAVGCATSAPQPPQPSSDELEIRTARISQNRAIAAGAFDDVTAFWTDDVTVRAGLGVDPKHARFEGRR
ncbi:MAG: hypothetical protein O7F70_04420 [Gemmatimonadetes bacterium]|nr:hypothetical protein [Gemmatimonadota bacterium]